MGQKISSPTLLSFTWVIRLFLRMITRIEIRGLEHLPPSGAVLANNHRSLADGPLLWVAVNRPMVFMATRGVFRIPLLGPILRWMGFIPVNRSSNRSIHSAQSALDGAATAVNAGWLVGIYPEGGIVTPTKRHTLKKGVTRLAKAGCTVVPVVTVGAERMWPMSGRVRWLPRLWRKVVITIHPPLQADMPDQELLETLEYLFATT